MSAGQDYNRTIKPGGAERINGNGETFIFCKFADRDITVDIAGRKVVMRAGSYQEFEPLVGNNAAVTLFNEDQENAAFVTLVMGTGTYDEKIIRGEITVAQGVRRADGQFDDDTRFTISANINPVYGYEGETFEEGDVVSAQKLVGGGTEFPYSDMADVFVYQGDVYCWVNGSSDDRLGLLRVAKDLSGTAKVYTQTIEAIGAATLRSANIVMIAPSVQNGFVFVQSASTQDSKIQYYDGTEQSKEVLEDVGFEIAGIAHLGSDRYLVFSGATEAVAAEYALNGTSASLIKTIDLSEMAGMLDYSCVRYDDSAEEFTFSRNVINGDSGGSMNTVITDRNFSPSRSFALESESGISTSGTNANKRASLDGYLFGFDVPDGNFQKRTETATELTLQGFASDANCDVSLIEPAYDAVQTRALVFIEKKNGQIIATGEIIRAFLEIYFRQFVGDGYMDHVYAVTIFNTKDGAITESAGGNGSTMARLKQDDNFTARFPGKMEVTIDSKLPKIGGF